MMNRSLCATLLMTFACISAPLSANRYTPISERQDHLIAAYVNLIQKWSPALDNPSDATIQIVIDRINHDLKVQMNKAFGDADMQKQVKQLMDDLKGWPMEFVCNELDNDIRYLFKLIENARILNIEINIDPLAFQELRAALDTLPRMERERLEHAELCSKYQNYILPGFGLVAAWYLLTR